MTTTPRPEDIEDWWEWNYADAWERQMEEFGYAELPDEDGDPFSWRMALLAEARWQAPIYAGTVPSRLWDASTPTIVGYRR